MHQSSVPSNITPLYYFSTQTLHTLVQRSPSKCKFLRFLSARVKIHQSLSTLKQQVNSSSSFASFFIAMTINSLVSFKLTHFLLWIKESHQSPNFETFKCSGENFPNSSCHFWKQKSVFLQILHQYSVLPNITPLYFFRSNIIYFVQKKPIKVQIFEIFECSGQNLSNFSCQFWTDKSIPLQILYHSSLSWHKFPL